MKQRLESLEHAKWLDCCVRNYFWFTGMALIEPRMNMKVFYKDQAHFWEQEWEKAEQDGMDRSSED